MFRDQFSVSGTTTFPLTSYVFTERDMATLRYRRSKRTSSAPTGRSPGRAKTDATPWEMTHQEEQGARRGGGSADEPGLLSLVHNVSKGSSLEVEEQRCFL